MIHLTRLNNQLLVVNSELIKFIERSPDTVLTLVSGEKVVVLETVDCVLQEILAFRRSIAERANPEVLGPGQPTSADVDRGKGTG